MIVKRRVLNKEAGTYNEVQVQAELVKKNPHSCLVKLENGDVILRKDKDVVKW